MPSEGKEKQLAHSCSPFPGSFPQRACWQEVQSIMTEERCEFSCRKCTGDKYILRLLSLGRRGKKKSFTQTSAFSFTKMRTIYLLERAVLS
jgi:hypothetical protein